MKSQCATPVDSRRLPLDTAYEAPLHVLVPDEAFEQTIDRFEREHNPFVGDFLQLAQRWGSRTVLSHKQASIIRVGPVLRFAP